MPHRLLRVFRTSSVVVLLFLPALMLLGCGGGGGAAPVGSIQYRTDWTAGRADPASGSGQSQVVSVLDLDGNTRQSTLLNRSTADSAQFQSLPAGTYRVLAQLYSLPDANGTLLGEAQSLVALTSSATVSTEVGSTVSKVRVSPEQASITQERSAQFYASAVSSAGGIVFVGSGAFAWDVLGGVGTVSADGLFMGSTVGTGAVRATHVASGSKGSSPVTVSPANTRRGKWTILVFLNAANDLYRYSVMNVNQMERVAGNPDVRFVIQWKQSRSTFADSTFSGTRRYVAKKDSSEAIASEFVQDLGEGVDMGSPQTLAEFIDWGKRNYPADHYGLIVWNHGSGWNRGETAATRAVSYDDELNTVIQVWQLGEALGQHRFDFIAWDASLMQMLEVAYEIKDNADYVIGSEESPPGEGYPYDLIFKQFQDSPDLGARALTKNFVDGMMNYPLYANRKITQSVLETDRLDELAAALDACGALFVTHLADVSFAASKARDQAQSYSPSSLRYYRDLRDYLQVMKATGTLPQNVYDAATAVQVAATQATVWEGHNANSANSTGIAIDATPGSRFSSFAPDYRRLKLAADTRWDEWLLVSP